jgi:hypothetical protein
LARPQEVQPREANSLNIEFRRSKDSQLQLPRKPREQAKPTSSEQAPRVNPEPESKPEQNEPADQPKVEENTDSELGKRQREIASEKKEPRFKSNIKPYSAGIPLNSRPVSDVRGHTSYLLFARKPNTKVPTLPANQQSTEPESTTCTEQKNETST